MIHDLSDSSAAPVSFGPFRVLHQIGVGVLGPVYRAQDSVREQLVAVKVFKVDAPPEQAEDIADALQTVARALPRHRGLLEYIAAGVERSTPYLVMTHSDVPSLDTKLKPGVPLDAEEALDLIATLADAIDAAHAKGIVHGTLHPRDVFVDDRGGCRVSGFGVATTLAAQGIRVVPVRRPYSPPERVVGSPIERSADLFALGALAFELFSGRRVVGVGLEAAVRCQVSAPDVDVEHLRTALAAMLAENPVHRPSSATAFAQAVTQAVRPRGLTAATARKRVTPQEIKPAALAAGAGAAAFSLMPKPSESAADTQPIPASTAQDAGPDALALFTRQGTLWEPTRQPADAEGGDAPLETVSIAPDEDPLAQFSSESDKPAAEPSASLTTPETISIPALAETQILPVPTEMMREPLEPAAAEAAAAPTVRLRIDDDSSDDDVASIADAARHLARLRERSGAVSSGATAASAAASSASSQSAADGVSAARAGAGAAGADDATADAAPELLRTVPRETVVRDAERVDTEVHAPLAASAVAGWAASASSAAASTSPVGDVDHRHDQMHDRLHDRAPEPAVSGPHEWTPVGEPEESGSNPLRVLFMVLAIGLAVGVAGGYLLGQRSALRQAFAIFGGGSSSSSSQQGASDATSAGSQPAATTPPTEVTEPTVVPEGSTPSRAASSAAAPPPRTAAREAATPTTARLLVRSSPARAEVTVNGVKRGETPVTLRDLPFGTHTIRVARGGYVAATKKVTLSASRASDAVEFALEPERAARTGNAPPSRPGSGSPGGAAGTRAPGIVAAGGESDLDRASAEATAAGLGTLWVLSHPVGARVLVDGQYLGTTPLMTNVAPGDKTVKLELPGHKAWSASVRVIAGKRLRVAASLEEGTEQ